MSKELQQIDLFGEVKKPKWDEHWQDMPEFEQETLTPFKTILVNFRNIEDFKAFEKLIGQSLTLKTKTIFYPKLSTESMTDRIYINVLNNAEKLLTK